MASPDRHFATAAIFTHSTGITPNSGDAALYIKSDNKAYIKDSSGTETEVGGGGGSSEYLPLSGGDLTGSLTVTGSISSSETISASGARVITGLPSDTTPVYYVTVVPQSAYDALGTPDSNTLYFISNP